MNNQPASGVGVASLVALGEHRPIAAESAFLAPGAVLIGHVTVSAQASIWYGAVLRADQDSIFVGDRSNIQDGCVLHADPGVPLSLGSDVTVGHTPRCTDAPSRTRSSSGWARSCSTERM